MIKILVRFYDVIIKHNHFLSRRLDVLDAMMQKEKGNKINKLIVMQTIGADLQLLMRMFLGLRASDDYENDIRISKHNHGSRKWCPID